MQKFKIKFKDFDLKGRRKLHKFLLNFHHFMPKPKSGLIEIEALKYFFLN